MKTVTLFTCESGLSLMNDGESFHAWGDDKYVNGDIKIEVDEDNLIANLDRSYIVEDLKKVKISR